LSVPAGEFYVATANHVDVAVATTSHETAGPAEARVSSVASSYKPSGELPKNIGAHGLVRIQVHPTAAQGGELDATEAGERLRATLDSFGASAWLGAPEPLDEDVYKYARALWQLHPQDSVDRAKTIERAKALASGKEKPDTELEQLCSLVHRNEVMPGYETLVAPGRSIKWKGQGAGELLHWPRSPALLAHALTHGPLAESVHLKRGANTSGQVLGDLVRTGGADSVMTRVLHKNTPDAGRGLRHS